MQQILIIAGLDPSGGAGILADVRVAAEHGVRPVGVVTALTEQDTRGVRSVSPVPAEVVGDQLRALLSDVEVAAVKIGMLGDAAIARQVADALALTAAPVVWDPVLRPTAGRVALYRGDPAEALALLAPHVAVLTPNAGEAAALTGTEVPDVPAARRAAAALSAAGLAAVLVKGGHLKGGLFGRRDLDGGAPGKAPEGAAGGAAHEALRDKPGEAPGEAIDLLAVGDQVIELRGPRVHTGGEVHGTGCALSTAIACRLAAGAAIAQAAEGAKRYVAEKLRAPATPGRGLASIL